MRKVSHWTPSVSGDRPYFPLAFFGFFQTMSSVREWVCMDVRGGWACLFLCVSVLVSEFVWMCECACRSCAAGVCVCVCVCVCAILVHSRQLECGRFCSSQTKVQLPTWRGHDYGGRLLNDIWPQPGPQLHDLITHEYVPAHTCTGTHSLTCTLCWCESQPGTV